jgi:hypothetical protein
MYSITASANGVMATHRQLLPPDQKNEHDKLIVLLADAARLLADYDIHV